MRKFRLPRTVMLSGKRYKVKTDAKALGGRGDTAEQVLVVGTKGCPDDIWDTYLHELVECIMIERGYRFDDCDRLRFVMTHNEFQNAVADVAAALWPLVKHREQRSAKAILRH